MSTDGDIVRAVLTPQHPVTDAETNLALAALARLEAAEARLGVEAEMHEAATEECREWQDAARTWQDNYDAAEAKSRDLMSALDALSGEPAMLDRLREAEAQRDDLQARADAIYAADRAQEQNIEEARQSHTMTAEDALAALAEALRMQGWDIGEGALCWCPRGWFDRELETGAVGNTEHSTGCRLARAALAEAGLE